MFPPPFTSSSRKPSNAPGKKRQVSSNSESPKPSAHSLSHQATSQGTRPETIPLLTRSKSRTVSENAPRSSPSSTASTTPTLSRPKLPTSNLRSTSSSASHMKADESSTSEVELLVNLAQAREDSRDKSSARAGERSSAPSTPKPDDVSGKLMEEEEEFFDTEGEVRTEEIETRRSSNKGKEKEIPCPQDEEEEEEEIEKVTEWPCIFKKFHSVVPLFDEPLYVSCSRYHSTYDHANHVDPLACYGVLSNGNMPQRSAESSAELRDVLIRWETTHEYHPFGNERLLSVKDFALFFPNIFYDVSSITPLPQQGRKPTLFTAGVVTLTAGRRAHGSRLQADTRRVTSLY
ncbi:hypothetical protein VKT23_004478 [Stygiomarasmius scandens]|uniref:Uncharacterized protein n=1 Tax=Marasmiellus scandens TaxID=2682957 RepID=A0ABR1JV46_9AGAR